MPPPVPTGPTISVTDAATLQAALDAATGPCEIRCAIGGNYAGNFTLRNVTVPVGEWIIVRADVTDAVFAVNTRPPYPPCILPAQAVNMAKWSALDTFSPTLTADNTAHNYWFYGIDFLPNTVHPDRDLIQIGNGRTTVGALPHHITFEACHAAGDATIGGHRGMRFDVQTGVVTACYFEKFFYGADSQAILIIDGLGPYTIENNYLESAGENFLTGGGDPTITNQVPSNITFRGNYCTKPLAWQPITSIQVKNLFELKLADTVLAENNVFENTWASAQDGSAILFTVRNQDNTAPWSTVKNVTWRYNIVKNCGRAAFNMLGLDDTNPSVQGTNVAISQTLLIDCPTGFLINNGYQPTSITRVTGVGLRDNVLQFTNNPIPSGQFSFTHNVTAGTTYGISGDSTGSGVPSLNAFAPNSTFTNNIIEAGPSFVPFPTGNTLLANGALAADLDSDDRYTPDTAQGADIDALIARIPWFPWASLDTSSVTVAATGTSATASTGTVTGTNSSVVISLAGSSMTTLHGLLAAVSPTLEEALTGLDATTSTGSVGAVVTIGSDVTLSVSGVSMTTSAGTLAATSPDVTASLTGTSATTLAASVTVSSGGVALTGTAATTSLGTLVALLNAAPGDLIYRATSTWKRLVGNLTTTRKFLRQTGSGTASAAPVWDQVTDADLSTSDVTTNNVSTSKHGFAPKSPADASVYLDGTGAYSVPPGTGTGTVSTSGSPAAGNLAKFSGVSAITNADLTGDVTTSGTVAATIAAGAVTEAKQTLADNTTLDVTSTKHGYVPKTPADATKFLNGAATAAFALVKDSDLSTSDITTNNSSSTKHGFAVKSPADATQFLNGAATPAYVAVKDSDLSTSDITTNNTSTSKHGFAPKLDNTATHFLDGTGGWTVPSGTGTTTAFTGASVATDETTTSTTYADLATSGPSVTVTTGTTALLVFTAMTYKATSGNTGYVSVAVSGATTVAASDANSSGVAYNQGNAYHVLARVLPLTGLTAGSNTFKLQYRCDAATTIHFVNRAIGVVY